MEVRDLPLAPAAVDHLEERGVETLYPPQAAAVEAGVAEGESVVAAVPTAAGKTLIAQIAMLSAAGRSLYVVPLRALATEKHESFRDLPGVDVGLATGDYADADADLADCDVVVATSEKVDAGVRNDAPWLEGVDCVAVDEIHLLDDPERGPTLEVTVAKLRRLVPDLQVVGLSATVANAGAVADWLDAALVESDWRPVALRRGVYDDGTVAFEDGSTRAVAPGDATPAEALARDAAREGGQCLAFVGSRRAARELAREMAEGADGGFEPAGDVAAELRRTATTPTGTALAESAAAGVAFHHAGLRREHRSTVEAAFRDGDLAAICATPTLAAGVNVPARRVVVRDHRRYGDDGYERLPVLEVHQMFGRAGRPGLDPHGEAVLVAGDADPDRLRERYLDGEPEAITSKLASERALRTHVLATLAGEFARTREGLRAVLASTFHAHRNDERDLAALVDRVLSYLVDAGMVAAAGDGDVLAATDLGALVSRVYVDPLTGAGVVDALRRAESVERVTPLTALEIVCDTADMSTLYVRNDEAGRLSEAAIRREDELARSVREFDGDFQAWLGAFKTARLLADLVEGADAETLVERYSVGPGDVRRTADRAAWLLRATESLADHVESDLAATIERTRERLSEREL